MSRPRAFEVILLRLGLMWVLQLGEFRMKRNIWIWNHYATNMFNDQDGRHFWFAENLKKNGYEATIFCASTSHNSSNNIDTGDKLYISEAVSGIPFVFVKAPLYVGNGKQRIKNMIVFYKNLFPVAKEYAKLNGKPDIILASSVHPLTLIAGIKIAKRFGVPCICEVRDLWPESFVAYDIIKKNNPLLKMLYAGEKWFYKKADKLIFTMEGGKDYIIEKGWDKQHGGPIDINKVYHINNGVDLDAFDYYKCQFQIDDQDLKDVNVFKVVYTGSIRRVNQMGLLLDVAKIIKEKGIEDIRFLIWDDGDEMGDLQSRVQVEGLNNVCFKGRVDKKYVPYITSQSQLNISIGRNNPLYRFGGSLNKMFDYFAAGKPLLFSFKLGYSVIEKYEAGIELIDSSAEHIAESIIFFKKMPAEEYMRYCANARKAAEDYDFKQLTSKLLALIEE